MCQLELMIGLNMQVGSRVELRIKDVPKSLVDNRDPSHPLVVYGLLQHEHKQSVLHFAVQRNTEYEEPVRAKVRSFPFSQNPESITNPSQKRSAGPPHPLHRPPPLPHPPPLLPTHPRRRQGRQQRAQVGEVPEAWDGGGRYYVWTGGLWEAELRFVEGEGGSAGE